MTTETLTPHDKAAEAAVLGAALVSDDRLLDVLEQVRPEDFFSAPHQEIARALQALVAERQPVDGLTVRAWLERHGKLDAVGGPAFLFGLTDGFPRGANIGAYLAIVRDRSLRRQLQAAGRRMVALAADEDQATTTLLDAAQRELLTLADGSVRKDLKPASALVHENWPKLERLIEAREGVTGLSTGFADLDAMTRGLQPGNLVLLAARPSMGKTAMALDLAAHAAHDGATVAFFSLEMSDEELTLRLLSSVGRLDGHRLQSGYLAQTDYARVANTLTKIAGWPLWVDDTAQTTVLEIRSKARRLKARHGLDLLVLDYLQLLSAERKYDNRVLELGAMSRMLKVLAKELECPVVALSQLSRAPETRGGDFRPRLSDLRESGSLEQDADLVLLLYREEVYKRTDDNEGAAEVIISKQRNGPTGSVRLRWHAAETRFSNATERIG